MYATRTDLATWVGEDSPYFDAIPADPTRVLDRAWRRIRANVWGAFDVDDQGLATDPVIVQALNDAQCAQVEQWLEVGEEHDIAGLPADTAVSSQGLSVSKQPSLLAPRARDILEEAGLLASSPAGVRLV